MVTEYDNQNIVPVISDPSTNMLGEPDIDLRYTRNQEEFLEKTPLEKATDLVDKANSSVLGKPLVGYDPVAKGLSDIFKKL